MNQTRIKRPLEQVLWELELIPRGDLSQNLFRGVYEQYRLYVLGRNAKERLSAPEVINRAVAAVRVSDPAFEARYSPKLLEPVS
jgi:hypothetical protein